MNDADRLIDSIKSNLLRGIIPLHEYTAIEWIQYGLISREFVDYFRAHPFGKTEKYAWETHKVDQLQNLYIRRIS
jgi:hypothetical protein